MTSLPLEVPKSLRHLAHVVSAYNTYLRLEKSLQKAIDKGEDVGQNVIYIRILGHLIHFVPTAQGLKTVIYGIGSCNEESASLLAVGKMYHEGVYAPSLLVQCAMI